MRNTFPMKATFLLIALSGATISSIVIDNDYFRNTNINIRWMAIVSIVVRFTYWGNTNV